MVVTAPCVASCEIRGEPVQPVWNHRRETQVGEPDAGNRARARAVATALLASITWKLGVTEFQEDHNRTATLLMDAARQAVEEDYAESIILGCTMEVGFHKRIEDQMGVPCI